MTEPKTPKPISQMTVKELNTELKKKGHTGMAKLKKAVSSLSKLTPWFSRPWEAIIHKSLIRPTKPPPYPLSSVVLSFRSSLIC